MCYVCYTYISYLTRVSDRNRPIRNTLQHTAMHCNIQAYMQHNTAHCNTATHYSALQRTGLYATQQRALLRKSPLKETIFCTSTLKRQTREKKETLYLLSGDILVKETSLESKERKQKTLYPLSRNGLVSETYRKKERKKERKRLLTDSRGKRPPHKSF